MTRPAGKLMQIWSRGRSFETLRTGLPQSQDYDLMYRHGLAVGADGRSLIMGSTTGQVWTSEDGGDHWSALGACRAWVGFALGLEPGSA